MESKNVNDSANFDKSVNDKSAVSELVREATVASDDSKSKEKKLKLLLLKS